MGFLWSVHCMDSRTFLLPDSRGRVLFVDTVLQHIYQHAQTSFWHREAGGQLFIQPHMKPRLLCLSLPDLTHETHGLVTSLYPTYLRLLMIARSNLIWTVMQLVYGTLIRKSIPLHRIRTTTLLENILRRSMA